MIVLYLKSMGTVLRTTGLDSRLRKVKHTVELLFPLHNRDLQLLDHIFHHPSPAAS